MNSLPAVVIVIITLSLLLGFGTVSAVPATSVGVAIVPPPLVGACAAGNFTTVPIDAKRYAGVWYEIAHSKSFPW